MVLGVGESQRLTKEGVIMGDLLSAECSGIVMFEGERSCKHGFPLIPQCEKAPMKKKVYGSAPCVSEAWQERLYPETGKPEQLCR